MEEVYLIWSIEPDRQKIAFRETRHIESKTLYKQIEDKLLCFILNCGI